MRIIDIFIRLHSNHCLLNRKKDTQWYTLPVFTADIREYLEAPDDMPPKAKILNKIANQITNHLLANHIESNNP